MSTDVSRITTFQKINIDPIPMNVVHENPVAVLTGPIVTEVNHRPAMGVTTPCLQCVVGSLRLVAPPGVVSNVADVMGVVGDRFNVVVDIRVEVPAALPLVSRALNHVVEVGNHAGG